MRQLQADEQVRIGIGSEPIAMRRHKRDAQVRDRALGGAGQEQLVRVRAAVLPDGDGFTAPDQFGAACPEMPPAPDRQIARLTVRGPVPAFHRQDAEPVADADAVDLDGARERAVRAFGCAIVERQRNPDGAEVLSQRVGRLERRDAGIARAAHSARSVSGRRGLRGWVRSVAMSPRAQRNCAAECL